MIRRSLFAAFIAAAGLPAHAADCRAVDASRASVSFQVEQAGAPFSGRFRRFGGEVCFSGGRVARIEVWLEPASVDAGLPEIDEALKGSDFFAVERYPRVGYESERVEGTPERQIAHGTLTIKGHSRALDAPFSLQRARGGLVISGALTLNRLDYGIGTGEWSNTRWLGAKVEVQFKAVLP